MITATKVGNVTDPDVKNVKFLDLLKMTLGDFLLWIAIPFVCTTIYFGLRRGENDYYETDNYNGNGTAH